jgi:hypothetical protein
LFVVFVSFTVKRFSNDDGYKTQNLMREFVVRRKGTLDNVQYVYQYLVEYCTAVTYCTTRVQYE